MRTWFEMRGVRHRYLSEVQVDEVRWLLLAAIAEEYTEFERQEAILVAAWPEDTTGLIRAMAALRMFSAREAIEAIADALARVDDGGFGLCSSGSRPLPFELLEAVEPDTEAEWQDDIEASVRDWIGLIEAAPNTLAIVGTRGLGGFSGLRLGRVPIHLVHSTGAAVVMVPPLPTSPGNT